MAADWEYRVSWVDDDVDKVHAQMAQYAEALAGNWLTAAPPSTGSATA